MHIHPSSPNSDFLALQSEENAAVRIQAGFRGYRVRKQLQQKPTNNNNQNQNNNKSNINIINKRQRNNSAALQLHQQHPSAYNMSVPNETSSSSAGKASINGAVPTTATAAIDGSNGTLEDRCATKIQAGVRGFLVRKKQKMASDAAIKIQASFRGFKARKEAQKLKQK